MFLNTTDGNARELLPAWVEEHGGGKPGDLERARAVREALRELLIANTHGRAPGGEAIRLLEEAADRSRITVRFEPPELAPSATGLDGALGRLLVAVFSAIEDGTWSRLKACRNCNWAFYDYSRNRSAGWCSMQLCGNRLKTRAYRRRRAARAG